MNCPYFYRTQADVDFKSEYRVIVELMPDA
jgi:hypothetical protein